jgi:hypothetical protein
LVDAVLDAGKGKVTMNINGKKYTYNFLRVSKHPSPFPLEDKVEARCKERWRIKLMINKMNN